MKTLNIKSIIIDRGTQSRAQISEETVSDYAESMQAGDQFPPVTVFFDGVDYFLADGFHRLHAAVRLGKASIQANVESGTLRDAVLYSLSVNNEHGLRRSNADKRKCVMTVLEDFEWSDWPVHKIAQVCCVSPQLVNAVKQEMEVGKKVSSAKNKPTKKKEKVEEQAVVEPAKVDDDAVQELIAENQRLADRLAVEAMDASEDEKLAASDTISGLREQIRLLEIENQSLKISRDTYQKENAELKKTVASLQRQLKKQS